MPSLPLHTASFLIWDLSFLPWITLLPNWCLSLWPLQPSGVSSTLGQRTFLMLKPDLVTSLFKISCMAFCGLHDKIQIPSYDDGFLPLSTLHFLYKSLMFWDTAHCWSTPCPSASRKYLQTGMPFPAPCWLLHSFSLSNLSSHFPMSLKPPLSNSKVLYMFLSPDRQWAPWNQV